MEKFIFFPKNEFNYFNEAKKYFMESKYQEAILFFEKAIKLKYIKPDCIKYLIDCHIELRNFEEVYKMIENEFVDHNVNEEYLLRKYLYTMVLDEQYIEASEIIKIYQQNQIISTELAKYFDELLSLINNKLNEKNNNIDKVILKYLTSDKFEDHIQIILNLEQVDYRKYQVEINEFLVNPDIDSFVKYNFVKHLLENNIVDEIEYTNYFKKTFTITKDNFINLLDNEQFTSPIDLVLKNIENDYPIALEFIKNIWLDFSVKYYPDLVGNKNLAACILHILLLRSLSEKFNINDICKLYDIHSKLLFQYSLC